jgi:hypothetical protein
MRYSPKACLENFCDSTLIGKNGLNGLKVEVEDLATDQFAHLSLITHHFPRFNVLTL